MSSKVIICHHSSDTNIAEYLGNYLKLNGLDTYLMSELQPIALNIKSRAVQSCNEFIVIASRSYQKTFECIELMHYAKDLKKEIFTVNPHISYKPFGALGAIAAGTKHGVILVEQDQEKTFQSILQLLMKDNRPRSSRRIIDILNALSEAVKSELEHTAQNFDVLVSYSTDAAPVAELIQTGLQQSGITNIILEEPSNGKSCIQTANVLVLVVSPGYEHNNYCRLIVEAARSSKKQIIPVKAEKKFKPEAWLGLAIAGKFYYRLFDKEQAYAQKYDSSPINDFIYGVKCALSPPPSDDNREKAQIEVLNKKIEECKTKLTSWPPKKREKKPVVERPVKVVIDEPKSDLQLAHIHYTVTRMDFKPPQPLFDFYGVPLNPKFDCMISYQWDFQELVREVYMDLHMKSLKMWFGKFKKLLLES